MNACHGVLLRKLPAGRSQPNHLLSGHEFHMCTCLRSPLRSSLSYTSFIPLKHHG